MHYKLWQNHLSHWHSALYSAPCFHYVCDSHSRFDMYSTMSKPFATVDLYSSLLVTSVPKRPMDLFTHRPSHDVTVVRNSRISRAVFASLMWIIRVSALAFLSRYFLALRWQFLQVVPPGKLSFAIYLSSPRCCNTASIRHCHSIQLLDLKLSISIQY